MKILENLKILLVAEILLLTGVIAGIIYHSPQKAASLYLYELLGAVVASIITTAGIYGMKDIT